MPEHRHKRIGEILFIHALRTASENGCKKMNIGIVEENQKLRKWYEKLGADHIGTKKLDFFPFTCGYMEKCITEGTTGTDSRQDVEFWDAYYGDGTLAGCDLIRGEKIPDGLRHAVAEVFVMHRDGTVLMTQRDYSKPNYPGFWESSAGGSVLKGERIKDGAKRELLEETGITVGDDLEDLYYIVTDTTIYQGYLCVTDIDKEDIRLQEGETAAFRWVDWQEFGKIFYSGQFVDKQRERLCKFVEANLQRVEKTD